MTKMRPLKKAWREVHEVQTALSSADIQPGQVLRTMKYAKKKDRKDPLRYVYGIVKLRDDSTTEIEYSYNFALPGEWASGGQINPDNGHIAFFPARLEHEEMVWLLLMKKKFEGRAKCLSAELDYQSQRNIVLINERDKALEKIQAATMGIAKTDEYEPPMHETVLEHWLNILLYPIRDLYGRIRKRFGK